MTAATQSRFLDLRALAALQHMRFSTPRRIEGAYTGRHRSRQQGGGGEFVDYREYNGGEDLRRLDWKVFARTGKAFIRLHQDETNLLCTLALDVSGSMLFNGQSGNSSVGSKLEYMQYLATAFSHVITLGQDQVGLAVLGDELREFLAPGGTITHVNHLQQGIQDLRARESTTMGPSLQELFERVRHRGVLMVVSDFLQDDLNEIFAALRTFRDRGWEVITLHLVHPDEERLPDGASFRFEGLEGEGNLDVNIADIRAEYQRHFADHMALVRRHALSAGCSYQLVSTAVPYIQILQKFLVERTG